MLITNFASGELSDNLNGRIDLRQYYQGASRIENFEIIPTGGIKRRPGTQRLAKLDGESRIIPFIVNKNFVYILQFITNPLYDPETEGSIPSFIKVWKNGVSGYSVVQTLNASYTSIAEIREIQYAQNYDNLVLVHRSYKPVILAVTAQGVFSVSEMEFDFSADVELDDDFDYVMVDAGTDFPSKEVTTDGHGRFTYKRLVDGVLEDYTKDFAEGITDFYCVKSGKLYKYENASWVVYGTDPQIDALNFTTATKYPGCVAFFNNRLFFASTMEARQKVWASAAPDNYGVRYNDFCTYKKYITVNKVVKDADIHIFTCTIVKANIDEENHRTTLTNVSQNFAASGALRKDASDYYVSNMFVPVGTKVVSVTSNTIIIDTSDLALTWDAEETEKDNIVMSIQLWKTADIVAAEDYEYMVVANNITTADCSFFFELASDENDAIMFLSSNRFLAVGTESSIWSIPSGVNALQVTAVMQGRYGSDEIQGMAVETATVYFAQGSKGIREFYYNGEQQAFQTNNIAILAEHILRESKVVDFDYMTNPYSRLLVVRYDGVVAQMLYDKTNGIMAWSRNSLDNGRVISCAVTRGDNEHDLAFFVVQQGNGIEAEYYLELLDYGSEVYLDSRSIYNPESLAPLEWYDTDKAILLNVTQNKTCPANDIPQDFIAENDVVYAGYKIKSRIKSMPVLSNDTSGRRRISALQIRFNNSYLPVMKCTDLPDEKFNTVQNVPYSGIAKANYPGITDHDVYFELKAEEPEAVNILSVDAITA